MTDADVVLVKDFARYQIGQLDRQHAGAFLLRHHGAYGRRARFLEGVLEQGEDVVVSGFVVAEADPAGQGGYRDVQQRRGIRSGYGVSLEIPTTHAHSTDGAPSLDR